MNDRCHHYVILRSEGLGAREAAREAGFSKGVPSKRAKRLWAAASKVHVAPGAVIEKALEGYRERIEALKKKVQEMEDIAEVYPLVAGVV